MVVRTLKALSRLATSTPPVTTSPVTLDAVDQLPTALTPPSGSVEPQSDSRTLNDCFVDSEESKAIILISGGDDNLSPILVRVSNGFRAMVRRVHQKEVVLNDADWTRRLFATSPSVMSTIHDDMKILKHRGVCESTTIFNGQTVSVHGHRYNDKEKLFIVYFSFANHNQYETMLIGPEFEDSMEAKCIIMAFGGKHYLSRVSRGYSMMFLAPIGIDFDPANTMLEASFVSEPDLVSDMKRHWIIVQEHGWVESTTRFQDQDIRVIGQKISDTRILVQFRDDASSSSSTKREKAQDAREKALTRREAQLKAREQKVREREHELDCSSSPKSARSASSRGSSSFMNSMNSSMRMHESMDMECLQLQLSMSSMDAFTETFKNPPHEMAYIEQLASLPTRPLTTDNELAEFFLMTKANSLRYEARNASIKATEQLSCFNLCSQKTQDGDYFFFNPIQREKFKFKDETSGITHIFGEEHAEFIPGTDTPWRDALKSFYQRSGLYADDSDEQWNDKLGRYEVTQVVHDPSGEKITGAQTSQLMYTGYDPIFYISLLYCESAGSKMEERLSASLSSDLIRLLQCITPAAGVGHLLTQSVGWTYKVDLSARKVTKHQSSQRKWKQGRAYWMRHLSPMTENAIHYGAQLCVIPGFVDGSCCFMHRAYKR